MVLSFAVEVLVVATVEVVHRWWVKQEEYRTEWVGIESRPWML
jgi:hypothetical protein